MISYDDIKSGRAAVPAEAPAVVKEIGALPAMVKAAAAKLASATTAAEVLDAKDAAALVYDASKRAARMAKAKKAHDDVIAAAHRAQADTLEIEAAAKRRLADEYDGGQERGEIATAEDTKRRGSGVPKQNAGKATAEDVGLTRKQVHDARRVRNAEKAKPGVVKDALEQAIAEGKEPTRAVVNAAVAEALGEEKPEQKSRDIFRDLVALWKEADAGTRQDFKAYIRGIEAVAKLNTPSASNPAVTVADKPQAPRPSATVPSSPDPRNPEVDVGRPHPSANVPSAQKDTGLPSVGQDGSEPCTSNDEFAQQPVSVAQARNEPGSVSGASVTNFTALSKADQIRLLRPYCRHADDLERCGGTGAKHCSTCAKIAAEGGAG